MGGGMTALQASVTGSLTDINGTTMKIEMVELEGGTARSVLLTVESRHGTEVEVLLGVAEAQAIGLDLMVFARDCQEFNAGSRA
ncbi:hypothetical protein D3875_03005 [Deinococcus cavernae]|uniref:Uncharacterized protein n=2 Tax=Deinococcus cavernae TaxID=2320857 RepID=A0A418VG00_9DEIO|nr:hypothetical protein D3875_03005 [Deinococcus cavernae]